MTMHPLREHCSNFLLTERKQEQQRLSIFRAFMHNQQLQYDTKCIFKVLMIDCLIDLIDWLTCLARLKSVHKK